MVLENSISTCRRMKLDLCLSFDTKTNSKCFKDLNVKLETLKLLDKNIDSTLPDTGVGMDFLNRTLLHKI